MCKGALGTGKKGLKKLQEREDTISPGTRTKLLLWPSAAFRAERASWTTLGSSCSSSTTPHLSAGQWASAVTTAVSFSSSTVPDMGEQRKESGVLRNKLNYLSS